ncbi:MAG: hypothetical protein Q8Q33_01030 [Chlamydiota bacterium]|nr:hypothetical protein [Chlamydiota bacterium]
MRYVGRSPEGENEPEQSKGELRGRSVPSDERMILFREGVQRSP